MASTYSPNLQLELMGTGDQAGTWGTTTNNNLGTLIEQAISGNYSLTVNNGTTTLGGMTSGSTAIPRNMTIVLVAGTLTANFTVTCPINSKLYVVRNTTSYVCTFQSTGGGTSVSIPAGASVLVYSDGTSLGNIYQAVTGATSANPTALVGLTAVNGSSTSFMRADASPAIDVSITPTWTGAQTFNGAVVFGSTAKLGSLNVGYLELPQNAQTGATYTAVAGDSAKHIYYSGSANASSTGSSGTSGTNTITTSTSVTGTFTIGQTVSGTGIASGAIISNITGTSPNFTLTLVTASGSNANNTATVSGAITAIPTVVIPSNASVAYNIGTVLTFINDPSAAMNLAIQISTDTMVFANNGSTAYRILARYGQATAVKIGTTRWLINGTGLT